jgi:hypothetical protein
MSLCFTQLHLLLSSYCLHPITQSIPFLWRVRWGVPYFHRMLGLKYKTTRTICEQQVQYELHIRLVRIQPPPTLQLQSRRTYPKLRNIIASRRSPPKTYDSHWTSLLDGPSTLDAIKEVYKSMEGLGRSWERHHLGLTDDGVHCASKTQSCTTAITG